MGNKHMDPMDNSKNVSYIQELQYVSLEEQKTPTEMKMVLRIKSRNGHINPWSAEEEEIYINNIFSKF